MDLGVSKASVQDYCRETHRPSVHLAVGTKGRLGLALETEPPQRYTDFVNEALSVSFLQRAGSSQHPTWAPAFAISWPSILSSR